MSLDITSHIVAVQTALRFDRNQESEPRRTAICCRFWQNHFISNRLQRCTQAIPVVATALNKSREFLKLFTTNSCLHISHFQIITEVAINIFVVVALGQLTKLTIKAVTAEVILTGGTNAITAPIAEGKDQSIQLRVIGVNASSLTHRHVMRRVKARSTNIAPSASKSGFTINGILGAQSVTVIFHQPQIMLITERFHRRQIKRIAQRMGDHDSLRFWRQSFLQLRNINVILRYGHIHKNRHSTILDGRGYGGWEAAGNCNNLVTLFDLSVTQFRSCQGHEGNQVGRRTAINQVRKLYTDPFCELLLKLIRKAASSQPEIQRSIGQSAHFLFIKYTSSVSDAVTFLIWSFLLLKVVIVLGNHCLNLFTCFCFIFPSRHL